jgi:hypothetical protein
MPRPTSRFDDELTLDSIMSSFQKLHTYLDRLDRWDLP